MMIRTTMRGWLVLAAVVAAGTVATAEEPAAPEAKKTEITAGRLDFDYQKMQGAFTSNVVVRDVEMTLETDYLWMALDPESQQISVARATGRVKILEKDRVATADQAEYNAREGKLVLSGNAMVRRGRELLRGQKITFWRGDNKIKCEPVSMVLFPEKGQSLQGMME